MGFFSTNQAVFHGERFFWKSPDDKTNIVGLGIAHSISGNEIQNRFITVENAWKTIVGHAIINNPYEISGTGPLLFGGFSFDPYSIKDKSWGAIRAFIISFAQIYVNEKQGRVLYDSELDMFA